jgi:hypothetical protein
MRRFHHDHPFTIQKLSAIPPPCAELSIATHQPVASPFYHRHAARQIVDGAQIDRDVDTLKRVISFNRKLAEEQHP